MKTPVRRRVLAACIGLAAAVMLPVGAHAQDAARKPKVALVMKSLAMSSS